MIRNARLFFSRWKYLAFACCLTYLVVFYVPIAPKSKSIESVRLEAKNGRNHPKDIVKFDPKRPNPPETREILTVAPYASDVIKFWNELWKTKKNKESREQVVFGNSREDFVVEMKPEFGESFNIVDVLTDSPITLRERFTCNAKKGEKRVILSWNAGHSQDNLRGCPDWNCEFTHDRSHSKDADAVLLSHQDPDFTRASERQYLVYFSQESPANSGFAVPAQDYFNMSLGFRHDTPAASPYGYTVRLAPSSYRPQPVVDGSLLAKKKKGAAWYVSHCTTNSHREVLVTELQNHFEVDKYGGCGPKKCPRNGDCEKMLDEEYFFYIAFENSICKDYNTEKLWRQGFQRTIVPLVLKRSIVEPFVPPHSFIAVDDFDNVKELAARLKYLMVNTTAYMEYFAWRKDYKVVFLDGANHDVRERPWGFCQLCRLLWEEPRQQHIINNWTEWWLQSCEKDGELVGGFLAHM